MDLLGPLGLKEEERYYAFFVFDPDGFRIEVLTPGPEWSSRIHRR
jgi:hypothetical protein